MLKKIYILLFVIITFSCDDFNESLKLDRKPIDKNNISQSNTPNVPVEKNQEIIPKPIETKREYSYDFNILDNSIYFDNLKNLKLPKSSFGVVINSDVKVYPMVDLASNNDLSKITDGELVSIGDYVDIIDVVKNVNTNNNYFYFKGGYNYFYKVLYKDRIGLIWGDNLLLDFKSYEDAKKLVYFIKNGIEDRDFLTFNGSYTLSKKEIDSLKESRIAFTDIDPSSITLNIDNPDEMVSLYKSDSEQRDLAMFITSDFILHSSHLIYNNFLQGIEENIFNNKIELFVKSVLKDINSKRSKKNISDDQLEIYRKIYDYFKVADVILNYNRDNTDFSINLLDESVNIQKELTLILNSGEVAKSPILGRDIDYSMFNLKGHYNKSRGLNAYFLAMTWLSKIDFIFNYDDLESTKFVLALTKLVSSNSKIYSYWEDIYTPYSYFVGRSEDLSLDNIIESVKGLSISEIAPIFNETEPLIEFLDKNIDSINVNSSDNPKFSILGERSDLHSYIFSNTSSPNINKREFVTGLDLISVLGSKSGFSMLKQKEGKNSYWPQLNSTINKLQESINVEDSEYWSKSLYNRYVELISSVAKFEQSRDYYFTEKPKWNQKVLNSVHGAWSEMDHDRVIYSKKGTLQEEAKLNHQPEVLEYDLPVSYVEPNLEFFKILEKTIEETITYIRTYNLKNEDFEDLELLLETITKLKVIVEKEVSNSPINEIDNQFIKSIPKLFSILILPEEITKGDYLNNREDLKMPIISNRFTDINSGEILESGVGIPLRMHILLNDEFGGKRVATGYTYSYYEFKQIDSGDISNFKWKEMVYNTEEDIKSLKPFWANPELK